MSRPVRPAPRRALRAATAITAGLAVALVPVAGLTGSASATSATTPTTPKAKGCWSGPLPTSVQGRPTTLVKGLPAGAWAWHDKRGFHLRVTHDSRTKLVFTGAVASSGRITASRILRDEPRDVLWRSSNHKAVRFVLRNHGGIDGIDFRTGCAKKITISLRAGGTPLTTTQIHLGSAGVSPTSNPVVIQRG